MRRLLILASLVGLIVPGAACSGSNASARNARPEAKPIGLHSDSDIDLWVQEALRLDPRVRQSDRIEVDAEHGIVRLSGTANNLLEKRYARLEAEKIAGVRGVIDEIALQPTDLTDDEIRAEIVRRLSGRPSLHIQGLEVGVADGTATLRGTARSLGELKHAELVASEVRGVREIADQLEVSYATSATDSDNRDQIVAALDLDPYLTGLPITVRVSNGVAALDGTVGNLYERRRAEEDVWRVASVRTVENDLKTDWLDSRGTRDDSPAPTDDEIQKAVRDAMLQDLRIEHPGSIKVIVRDGTVSLEGVAPDWYQKNAIESDAEDVVGVEEVLDLVQVGANHRDDSLIASELRLDLTNDYLLGDRDIDVNVHDGVATLSGSVETPYERQHAGEVAHRVLGVREVVNDIRLPGRAAYTDAALADHVRARLRSNWKTRPVAEEIRVTVEEGTATLAGRVDTWAERLEAGRVASRVDGIRKVHNQLAVEAP